MQKDGKKTSKGIEVLSEFDYVAEKATKQFRERAKINWPSSMGFTDPAGVIAVVTTDAKDYIPKTERLLAIYDMLTDKSFPRKGAGKSTKPKILDAIIEAVVQLKLKLGSAHAV